MAIIMSRLILNLRHLSSSEDSTDHHKNILTPPIDDPEQIIPRSVARSWFSSVVFRTAPVAWDQTQGSQPLSRQEYAPENSSITRTHRALNVSKLDDVDIEEIAEMD